VKGTRTTGGSKVLLQEPPDQSDAFIVHRLRTAGAIIIGKTNLHEFASGDPDPAGPFGLVQNPRRVGYHPGSSSSGAGAATASGLGVIGIGTDTGGSARVPAYLCGVTGLKPTFGKISLEGIIPLSPTLDTVGMLARRVSDVAVALTVCTQPCPSKGKAISDSAADILNQLEKTVRNWRIGIPIGKFVQKVQPAVAAAFENTFQLLRDMGCQLIEFDPLGIEVMPELTTSITHPEAALYHERYRSQEHLYGAHFYERLLNGRGMKTMTYIAALQQQLELKEKWLEMANLFDVLVVPSGPAVAPPHGATTIEINGEHFPFRDITSRFTRPFNLLGWPALSVPNGVNSEGLPTGIQIAGPPESEARLLILGHHLEQSLGLTTLLGIEPKYPM